jgi:hydrogenase maturation protease
MIRTMVICVGNRDRGDDGAALEVARRLRRLAPPNAFVHECAGQASCLMEDWRGRPRVILVNAASGTGRPGSVHRYAAHTKPLPTGVLHASSHSWGVAEAIEMARALGQLPPETIVYAIEGRSFGLGHWLSPEVELAADEVVEEVLTDLADGWTDHRRRRRKRMHTRDRWSTRARV